MTGEDVRNLEQCVHHNRASPVWWTARCESEGEQREEDDLARARIAVSVARNVQRVRSRREPQSRSPEAPIREEDWAVSLERWIAFSRPSPRYRCERSSCEEKLRLSGDPKSAGKVADGTCRGDAVMSIAGSSLSSSFSVVLVVAALPGVTSRGTSDKCTDGATEQLPESSLRQG